jgi:flagellar hook-length control protein FliK
MSATISTVSSPAASVVQATLPGSGDPEAALASADAGNPGQFTALFQQLLGKQASVDAALDPMALTAGVTEGIDPADIGKVLDALLPFLEVMELNHGSQETAEAVVDAIVDGTPLAVLAGVITPQSANNPAISAVKDIPEHVGKGPATGLTGTADLAARPEFAGAHGRGGAADGEFSSLLAAVPGNPGEKPLPQLSANPAGHVPNAISHAPTQSSANPLPALPVAQTVGAPGWGQELGNRIAWMASRMESRAELVLNPPQMGRIEVSLTVVGDQASAIFTSANPVVREALETAMPRLRELLADAGIQLGQAQVGAENARQSAQQEKNGDNFALGQGATPETGPFQAITDMSMTPSGLKMGRGLVDVFA